MTKKEAIKTIKANYPSGGYERLCEALDMAIEALEDSRWIPVTERLPEDGEGVLATHLGGINPNRQVIEHIYQNGRFTCGWDMDLDITSPTFGQRYMGDVIAWMSKPKPYEEGAEE